MEAALISLRSIYRPGYNFAKAGVMLLDLQEAGIVQGELDLEPEPQDKGLRIAGQAGIGDLMAALDKLNRKFGKGTVQIASSGLSGDTRAFSMKQERRTPAYTTKWSDIPIVRA